MMQSSVLETSNLKLREMTGLKLREMTGLMMNAELGIECKVRQMNIVRKFA